MKAFVRVYFKEEGGRKLPAIGSSQAKNYCPHILINGGKGDILGIYFSEDVVLEFGKNIFTEITSMYDNVDYSEVQKDVTFNVLEGSLVVAEGRVLAVRHDL